MIRKIVQQLDQRQRLFSDGSGPIVADQCSGLHSEGVLVAVALAIGAREVPGWSATEERLATQLPPLPRALVAEVRELASAAVRIRWVKLSVACDCLPSGG